MKILGIDDNEELLGLSEVILTAEGHEYTGIDNGRDGLQAIKDNNFDLVLLDLSMPDFSGEDVMKGLVEDDIMDKQKIVLFTASSVDEIKSGQILGKAHSVITKPLDVDELVAYVQKISSEITATQN